MGLLRGAAAGGLPVLNGTGTLMYDSMAALPHSFLHMVSSSPPPSEQPDS